MGRFVIVAYSPKKGMIDRLLAAVHKHMTVLRAHDLITDRPAYVMRSKSGAIVEVFEWLSAESVKKAHSTPSVQELWEEFGAVCEYTPLSGLEESDTLFAEFDSVEF